MNAQHETDFVPARELKQKVLGLRHTVRRWLEERGLFEHVGFSAFGDPFRWSERPRDMPIVLAMWFYGPFYEAYYGMPPFGWNVRRQFDEIIQETEFWYQWQGPTAIAFIPQKSALSQAFHDFYEFRWILHRTNTKSHRIAGPNLVLARPGFRKRLASMIALDRGLRFQPGEINITAGAAEEIPEKEIRSALARHLRGDWGELGPEGRQRNDEAVEKGGGTLASIYTASNGVRFYILTEADRSATTVLLPTEY